MENNNNDDELNIKEEENYKNYSSGSTTGPMFSIIFLIIALVGMYLLSKYLG